MALYSSVRNISGKVEVYDASTLLASYSKDDYLKSFSRELSCDNSKFFGFALTQKINVKLIDKERVLDFPTNNFFIPYLKEGNDTYSPIGKYKVTEVHRDENTNALSITAYDLIYFAGDYTVEELELEAPYTIGDFIEAVATKLGFAACVLPDYEEFDLSYAEGANFDGDETLREALDMAAEATQTIYLVNESGNLEFKRLTAETAYSITKEDYFTLSSKTNRKLVEIVSATELGDNISASLGVEGTTQYVRDNAFWDLREDRATLVTNALVNVGGMVINQFEMEWRGNYFFSPGSKLALTTKDNETVNSWLLSDTLEFNGGLTQETEWSYEDTDSDTSSDSASIGEVIKKTQARVDKVNQTITLTVSKVEDNKEQITAITENQNSIALSVTELTKSVDDSIDGINGDITELEKKVEQTVTPEQLEIAISNSEEKGANKVTTTTGFVFNDEGLNISKTGSDITTLINEDGMRVSVGDEERLIANNEGVEAVNLHATTYLIVGTNSRFEDYGEDRTGCFRVQLGG